jgi:hypothetical protein
MKVDFIIGTIPHAEQAYPTVGNYFYDENSINVVSSDTGDSRMNFLIQMHELIEAFLCRDRGIKDVDIVAFDKEFEANRTKFIPDDSEPGDHPNAPYRKEHFFATNIERMLAAELGIKWHKYETRMNELMG